MTRKQQILRVLNELYPDAAPELNFANPYETLCAVILSAQCTDQQVNRVTPTLFACYPTVQAMAQADVGKVHDIVRSCGFKSKAQHLVDACRMICERYGGEVPRTMEELTVLPGVGRKTANVVMACAFGIPALAVDTHVFRVSNRLGLCRADNVLDTEEQLKRVIPKKDWIKAHHLLIFHGRRVCHARAPACGTCALNTLCGYTDSKKEKA